MSPQVNGVGYLHFQNIPSPDFTELMNKLRYVRQSSITKMYYYCHLYLSALQASEYVSNYSKEPMLHNYGLNYDSKK